MIGGFSFDGIDIGSDKYKIEYIPEKRDVYPFSHATYNVHDKSFDEHDGGYFFGTTVQPKQFTIRCFFEEIQLRNGIISKIESLFRRGRTGKLIFKDREWIYYIATVVSLDLSNIINMKSQIFTITMKAYYPYGRSIMRYLSNESSELKQNVINNSEIMEGSNWNRTIFAKDGDLPSEGNLLTISGNTHKTYYLFNPGTEEAHALIHLKGYSEEGFKMQQTTRDNCCRFNPFGSSDIEYELKCDSLNGKTIVKKSSSGQFENGFLYHDSGFITVLPMFDKVKRISGATLESGSTIITVNDTDLSNDLVGQIVMLSDGSDYCENGYIGRINSVSVQDNEATIVIDSSVTSEGEGTKDIVIIPMERIEVSSVNGGTTELSIFNIDYMPTFA